MVAFKERSGGALPYQKLRERTSTSLFKSDQWSLLKKEVEVRCDEQNVVQGKVVVHDKFFLFQKVLMNVVFLK